MIAFSSLNHLFLCVLVSCGFSGSHTHMNFSPHFGSSKFPWWISALSDLKTWKYPEIPSLFYLHSLPMDD